jgi:hypothetical protein
VDLERQVNDMSLPAELGDLVKSAARAILVQNSTGLERASRQLMSPFEEVMPGKVNA